MTEPFDPNPQYPQPPGWAPPPSWPQQPASWPPHDPAGAAHQTPYGAGQPYQPGYPPPGYPPPPDAGWPGQPPPYAGWPGQPPAPPRRRKLLIPVLIVVVLIAATVAAFVVFRAGNGGKPKLALPASFDGYTRVTNGKTGDYANSMQSMMSGLGGSSSAVKSATVGFYSLDSGDSPRLVVFALRTPADTSSSEFTDQLQRLGGASVQSYPAGPHGGASSCGRISFGTIQEIMCAWSDPQTSGVMVSVLTPLTPGALAGIERDFRDQVD